MNILRHGDDLYVIKRTIRRSSLKIVFDVELFKQYYRSDTILVQNGVLFFCEKIEEVQIILDEQKLLN